MKDHSELGGMFDMTGVVRGEDGIKRYEGLPRNLVQMFRAAVDRDGAAEAVVETGGGPRLSYASLWDRAARVAGGLRGLGVQRGDRVAIRLGNGIDWVLAFLGAVLADAIVVPVNTRFTEEEANYVVTDSGAAYVFTPGAALPDGDALAVDDAEPSEPGRDLLHQRHHRVPQGRGDQPRELPVQRRDLPPGSVRGSRRACAP